MLTMRDEHDPGDQGFDPWNFAEIFGTEEKMRWEWSFDFRPGKRYPIVKRVNTVIDDNFTLMRTRTKQWPSRNDSDDGHFHAGE